MANINQALTFPPGTSAPSLTNLLPFQRKQAWLQALEKAGLSVALNETRMIETPAQRSIGLVTDYADDVKDPSMPRGQDSGNDLVKMQASSAKKDTIRREVEADFQLTSSIQMPEEQGQGVSGENKLKTPDAIRFNAFKGRSIAFSSLALDNLQYRLQNMVVLNSDTGVEVWIRDAGLSKVKLLELLKMLRSSTGSIGAGFVRVVLNGQDIFSSQQSAISEV
jgi:hypothetical protein